MVKVIRLWCEWDLGLPELYKDEETLISVLEDIDLASFGLEDFQNYDEMMKEGFLGFEEEEVID